MRRRSTASPRSRYDARSTSAGPPPRCTPSWRRSRGRRCPQPLTYLVDDAVRTFGQVRVGLRRVVRAVRRRGRARRARPPPEGGRARAPAARADRAGQHDAGRPAAGPAARARRRAGRRGPRRHRPGRPARTSCGRAPRGSAALAREDARHAAQVAAAVRSLRAGDAAARVRPGCRGVPRRRPLRAPRRHRAARLRRHRASPTTRAWSASGWSTRSPSRAASSPRPRPTTADDVRTFAVHRISLAGHAAGPLIAP